MPFDPVWEDIHNSRLWGQETELVFGRFLNDYYLHDKLFLDIGCGTGAATLAIARLGYKVIAVDGSKIATTKLHDTAVEEKLDHLITTKVSDVMALDFKPESLDCITDISCLSQVSLEEAVEFLKRAKVWLKPCGMIFSRLACEPYSKVLLNAWGEVKEGYAVRLWSYNTRLTTEEMLGSMFNSYVASYEQAMIKHTDEHVATHFYVTARKVRGI